MSEKLPLESGDTGLILSWASQLASESRDWGWIEESYVVPNSVRRVLRQLGVMRGGVIGLVGFQGVGKSSALMAIYKKRNRSKRNLTPHPGTFDTILFKWRRQAELFSSLLTQTYPSSFFHKRYEDRLLSEYKELLLEHLRLELKASAKPAKGVADFLRDPPMIFPYKWVEKKVGSAVKSIREQAWRNTLSGSKAILIDTPDYSKTDRRLMAKDLNEIYWLWNSLIGPLETKPNLVVAIQKEMFGGHFFFDKMEKIELEPLKPEQMLEAYVKRFKTTEPFTEDALLTLARMSRGIFRRFLRYITLTLEHWQAQPRSHKPATSELVKEAVTTERLAMDMELELTELFPKQSDLRIQAVRILLHLSETGPQKQSQLAEELNLELYAVSRLLSKLELHSYVTRSRTGTDKIVSLKEVK